MAVGRLFDDGCYGGMYSDYTLAVNANSRNKEGAWEFISYLIGEESQGRDFDVTVMPVHRGVFEVWLQEMIEKYGEIYGAYKDEDLSAKKQEEYRNAVENVRFLPLRTVPVLKIILEEAEDYFNGTKSAEEVSRVLDNRVQLFLDEEKN